MNFKYILNSEKNMYFSILLMIHYNILKMKFLDFFVKNFWGYVNMKICINPPQSLSDIFSTSWKKERHLCFINLKLTDANAFPKASPVCWEELPWLPLSSAPFTLGDVLE